MELKEALFYKKLRNKDVACQLCPRFCIIKNGMRGNCGTRTNISGALYGIVYGKPCSLAIDPIEKKPFYHFLPATRSLSIGTVGCNLHCLHCQNWQISQAKLEDVPHLDATPEAIVQQAKANKCKSISFTYTEPTVFYEYMLDIAKLAKKEKIKCTIVSNGYINPSPLKKLIPYLKAANIDLKGNALFYEKVSDAKIQHVLETLKLLKQKKVWTEITNLIIPGYNDNTEEIKETVEWIKENLGTETPLHFSAFYPCYKLNNVPATEPEFLFKARAIAKQKELKFVYTGNIKDEEGSTTYCDKCNFPVIIRKNFNVIENKLKRGKCPNCQNKLPGIW